MSWATTLRGAASDSPTGARSPTPSTPTEAEILETIAGNAIQAGFDGVDV